jgi:ATP-dependent exoDNAse (exonuclease V) beta subunit
VSDTASRAAIVTRLDDTLFVEAGAGTGKTTALVGRVVALVRSGVPMRNIAAITFTEAAAAELRERVRRELERAAAAEPSLAAAVDESDEAAISTLHAFAQRILAEHPLEAGLPPVIEVLDEIESGLHFEERWTAFVDRLLDDAAVQPVLLRAFACGLSRLEPLRELALALHDHRDRLTAESAPALPPPQPLAIGPVLDALRAAADLVGHCYEREDRLAAHLSHLAETGERLASAGDDLEILQVLVSSGRWECNLGRAADWLTMPVEDVRAACTAAAEARRLVLDGVKHEIVAHLLHELVEFTLETARERTAQGRLDFHDLLVEARDLLRARPDVRAALRERYTHLLVDEFQDTDPIQVELAVMLAADEQAAAAEVRSWRDVHVSPGRLFFVGDAKQSIYRFRRADIALFLDVQATLAEGTLQLSRNFRSVPGVLAWVNAVFAHLIGEGVDGAQARYEPLAPARGAGPEPAPVVVLGGPTEQSLSHLRETEAADVARTIIRAVEQEFWIVGDDGAPGGQRAARLSDVAVLLPTRLTLPQLEAAFDDFEIPFRVETASLVWGTQAVRDLLAVLRAVDDPNDEVALVAALRSPALACTDRELLEYHQAGGRWRLDGRCPEALDNHPVCRALTTLRGLADRRWWDGVATVVDRAVHELRFVLLAFAHARPRDHWRRLRFVVDQARAFEEAGGRTLREFLSWAERQGADDARVREPTLPEDDDDAVRILTVHGAKGLEWPIVILTGLNRQGGGPTGPTLLWSGDRPEVKFGAFATAGFGDLVAGEKTLDAHEQTRLLYVAATRAKDHLVVSLHHKASDNRSQAYLLYELIGGFPHLWRELGPPLFRMQRPPAGRRPVAPVDAAGERQRWAAARDERIGALRRVAVRSATSIAAAGDAKDERGVEARPWQRGRAGTAIGRAVHGVLQSVDLATGRGLADLARAQAAAEGVDTAAATVERLVASALASDAVKQAVAARHWRELYVAAPIGATTVEGFVDLAYDPGDGSGLVLVDYKTDAVRSDAERDASVARYRLQLGAYALALETSLGSPVTRGVLVFLGPAGAVEREVVDLGAAAEEVRQLVVAGDAEG